MDERGGVTRERARALDKRGDCMIIGAGHGDSGQYEELMSKGIGGLKYHGVGISRRDEQTSGKGIINIHSRK